MQNLHELLETVHDERSLLAYIDALRLDWEDEQRKEAESPSPPYSAGHNGWENGSIGQFLDAAFAGGSRLADNHSRPADNPWKRCAEILYIGKIYE